MIDFGRSKIEFLFQNRFFQAFSIPQFTERVVEKGLDLFCDDANVDFDMFSPM